MRTILAMTIRGFASRTKGLETEPAVKVAYMFDVLRSSHPPY
jgi:hypothetical protein